MKVVIFFFFFFFFFQAEDGIRDFCLSRGLGDVYKRQDQMFVEAVKATGRKKLVMAALWTEVCLNFPTLMAIEAGYEVYIVTDASGGTSVDAHERSIDRMVQAGAIPVTWQQVLLEYQRDWSRKETYDAVMGLVQEHSGAYGMGVDYAYTMVHKAPQRVIR